MIQENLTIYKQIIAKAIEILRLPTTEQLNTSFANMTLEERTIELQTQKVLAHKEGDLPSIFVRFVEDKTPLVEAVFYPYLAVDSFWDTLQNYYKDANLSDEVIEEMKLNDCIYMTVLLFKTLDERMLISIGWFTNEVIDQWYEKMREENVQVGYALPKTEITKMKRETFQGHNKDIQNFWKSKSDSWLNQQYISLAIEYPKILEHWQFLGHSSRHFEKKEGVIDGHAWRKYAKPTEFSDTADDLLNEVEFMNSNDVWKLAIEHAARRVGLFKVDSVKPDILEKRKKGIMKTGYDSNYLLSLVKKGDELLVKIESENDLNET